MNTPNNHIEAPIKWARDIASQMDPSLKSLIRNPFSENQSYNDAPVFLPAN